jgi:hypothetical protein
MAEEEGKNPVVWPDGAEQVEKIEDFEFLMAGNKNKPILKMTKNKLNEILVVQGDSMPTIEGGATAATAVELPTLTNSQNRWFDAAAGYWKYNGVVLKNPLGSEGILTGNDGTLYWDKVSSSWSISKMQLLPKNEDLFNATVEVPLGSGYYDETTAKAAVPVSRKKKGMSVLYEESAGIWKKFTFTGNIVDWTLSANWLEEFVGKAIDTRMFSSCIPKAGVDLRKIFTNIKVKMSSNANNTVNYVSGEINPICIYSFGITGNNYRLRLAEKVGNDWVAAGTPEFNQVGGTAPTTITFVYRSWEITITVAKWLPLAEYYDFNMLNEYLFHGAYYNNKVDYLEPLSGLTFSTSSSLDSLLEINDAGDLLVSMPGTSVLFNKRQLSINISTANSAKSTYALRKQEFLYVDLPKSWALYSASSGVVVTIQQGNYVAAVTDDRGTIPLASLVSPDKDYIRYIIISTGQNPYMITKNNLPQNGLAKRVNSKIFQWSKTFGGIDLNDVIESLTVDINANTNELYTYNVAGLPEMAIYSIGRNSGISKVRIGEYVAGAWVQTEIYSNASSLLEFSCTYRQYTLNFKLKYWPTLTEFWNSHRLNSAMFQIPYTLNKVQYLEPVSGISYSTGQSIKNIVTFKDNILNVDVAGTCVMYNKRNVSVEARTPTATRTIFKLKRQEFLYVDILKSWAIASYKPAGYVFGTIQQGNYVAAVTDERGTIPLASIVSPDKDYIRYILIMTGQSANMITKNNLPQTPTVEQVKEIVEETIGGIPSTDLIVKASAWVAKNKLREDLIRAEYIRKVGDEGYVGKWYGVQYTEQDSDNTVRINSTGDTTLHHTLPIQSLMRRCVTKKGKVIYYLHPENSELKADGTPAKLDGTDGNVMVEIPEFFYKFEEDTSGSSKVVKVKLSQDAFPDYIFSPKRYTSAYEATTNRTNNTLASVCTTNFNRTSEEIFIETADFYAEGTSSDFSLGVQKTAVINNYTANAVSYRGGTNDATLDSASGNQISRCQLGRPIANVRRADVKSQLQEDEFIYQYDTARILYMLAFVEFAKRDFQKPIQVKNPNDVTNGGMGLGSSFYPSYDAHANFYTPYGGISLLPAGITNNLGNKTGEVYFKIQNAPVESTGDKGTFVINRYDNVWMPVMSYRGVEQYYGHIYKIADQINVIAQATGNYAPGHEGESIYQITDISYYYEPNPYLTNGVANPAKKIWQGQFQGYACITKMLLGELGHILPIDAKEFNYSIGFCDATEILPQGAVVLYITLEGRVVSKYLCGPLFIVAHNYDSGAPRASDGTRLDHF